MILLLDELAYNNRFITHTDSSLQFSNNDEHTKAKQLSEFNKSLCYTEHINWINFTKYDLPKPIYINLIRHPIHRVMSAYYYLRKPSVFAYYVEKYNRTQESKDFFETSFNDCVKQAKRRECIFADDSDGLDWRISSMHFCGNENVCFKFNSKAAVQLAKRNIEQEYAVVGSWEETSITLAVLEHYIPRYFKNATNIYYSKPTKFKTNVTPHNTTLEPEVETKLNKQFANEIDLYYFCKQRLYKQYIAIKREQMIDLKSLNAHRLNNTRKADIEVVFFNRCAKVGSEALLELFKALETFNEDLILERKGLNAKTKRQWILYEQQQLAEKISELVEGSILVQHVNWIDFDEFDLPKPIYINMVRDPVERVISWYFYARSASKIAIEYQKDPTKPEKPASWYKKDFNNCVRSGDPECQYVPFSVRDYVGDYKRQSLFFCGHHPDCIPFNSPAAVQIAKEHVERDYAVVGTWEETNITLTVFEKYIPRFFNGAKILYDLNIDKITNRNRNKHEPKIDADVKEMIRKNFTHEYEFYNFCKQRLYKQYLAVTLKDLSDPEK